MRGAFKLIIIILIWASSAFARILNIPADYPTIQAGIDAAINGDTVLVAPGEYEEDLLIQDKNIFLTSAEGPTATAILGHAFLFGAAIDTTCALRGFRLDGHYAGGWPDQLAYSRGGGPTICGNIMENNSGSFTGAGILLEDSPAIVRGNIIRNNWATDYGGGIDAIDFDTMTWDFVTIEGNIVSGNWAGDRIDAGDAGGISMARNGVIRYNLVTGNRANRVIYRAYGGGISSRLTLARIYNNTIVGNMALGQGGHGMGGGIFLWLLEPVGQGFAKNNIIAFNPFGGGIYGYVRDSAYIFWDYNLVFGNDTADYVGITAGMHDIQSDPLFVDRFSGDFRLLPNSPCIDAGDPSFPLDPDSTRADIGAYYFDQSLGIDDDGAPSGPYQFALKQNYPNPFNGETIISYYLDKESTVSLFIFSITGHLVLPLLNKEIQEAGEHNYLWEGRDANGRAVSTGIYFYELYVNEYRESKAMILIK
jgi:hypothetical protein